MVRADLPWSEKISIRRNTAANSWPPVYQVDPNLRNLEQFFPRIWNVAAAPLARTHLFGVVELEWALKEPTVASGARSHGPVQTGGRPVRSLAMCPESLNTRSRHQCWKSGHFRCQLQCNSGMVSVRADIFCGIPSDFNFLTWLCPRLFVVTLVGGPRPVEPGSLPLFRLFSGRLR